MNCTDNLPYDVSDQLGLGGERGTYGDAVTRILNKIEDDNLYGET